MTHLLPIIMQAANGQRDSVSIFGNGFSVKEVIQQVKDIIRKDFVVKEEGRRDVDPSTLIASDSKAKEIILSKA